MKMLWGFFPLKILASVLVFHLRDSRLISLVFPSSLFVSCSSECITCIFIFNPLANIGHGQEHKIQVVLEGKTPAKRD